MLKRPLLIVALAAFISTAACGDPATMANGVVDDEQGNPLPGVEVVMESQIAGGFRKESEQSTGEDGKFNFVSVTGAARLVRLRFSKEGYEETTLDIPARESSTHKVVLRKK